MKRSTLFGVPVAAFALFSGGVACANEKVTYTYDELGRLIEAKVDTSSTSSTAGQTTTTSYDPAGNRATYGVTGAPLPQNVTVTLNSNPTVNEGGALTFTFLASPAPVQQVSITYATASGTAISPTNFTAKSGTYNLVAGQSSGQFTVQTINDGVYTQPLTMQLGLTAQGTGVSIGGGPATGTINNINPAPTVTIALSGNASVNEGGILTFTLTASPAPASAVSVNFATANGSATAPTNYATTIGTASFAQNQTSTQVTVPTVIDNVFTPNLTMALNLSSPSSGATLGAASATGTINNINPQITLALSGNPTVTEGGALVFDVTATPTPSGPVTVNYATSNGTAIAPTNYTTKTGTLSFAANQATGQITVPTLNDNVTNPNLTMTMTLSSPGAGAALGNATATGTITDVSAASGSKFVVVPLNGFTVIPVP